MRYEKEIRYTPRPPDRVLFYSGVFMSTQFTFPLFISLVFTSFQALSQTEAFIIFNQTNECRGCGLKDQVFSAKTLQSTNHMNANLAFSYLLNTQWDGINLQGAALHNIHGDGLILRNCNLRLTNFSHAELPGIQVDPSNHLEVVNFTASGLEFSDFSGVTMDRPYFTKAAMEAVNFQNAFITEGKFINAWMPRVNFKKATLRRCDFSNAKLSGVDFSEADLEGSILSDEQLQSVKSLCNAILPNGKKMGCN